MLPLLHAFAGKPENFADELLAAAIGAQAEQRMRLLELIIPDQADLNLAAVHLPQQVAQVLAVVARNFLDPRKPVLLPDFQMTEIPRDRDEVRITGRFHPPWL